MAIRGILFDKDGTLFDFGATWNGWAARVFRKLAKGDTATERRLAEAARYDLSACAFLPDSPVIAGTNREAAALLQRVLPGCDLDWLDDFLAREAAEIDPVAPVPLAPLLDGLRARGLALGVMTNDSEFAARAQLEKQGVTDRFDFLAGFDSGYGAKPDCAPLLAFAAAMSLDPAEIVMVGDSTHDLIPARQAGMGAAAVLSGPAGRCDLAPYADVVLAHIGELPGWLDTAPA